MRKQHDFDSIAGAIYSFVINRPKLSILEAKLAWRGGLAPFYERMSVVSTVPAAGVVVDCPTGGGVALRALDATQDLEYVAVDISPPMLRRAKQAASRRGLTQVRFVEADAANLPLDDSTADMYLANWGLHCFEDPEASLHEAARVLKPGGTLHGVTFVRGDSWRQKHIIKDGVMVFRKVAFQQELEGWISNAGFEISHTELHGPMFYFDAIRL